MKSDTRREVIRKVLHMAMGLFALCLRWLAPWQAALCALAALAHNLWLFPRYGMKRLERPEEKARGYSGMIGYPAVVLVLILLCWKPFHNMGLGESPWSPAWYPWGLAIAAAAWAILAFGDAFGALSGILLGGPRLPWNRGKRWLGWLGFTFMGGLFGTAWYHFVAYGSFLALDLNIWEACFLAAFLAGLVETLPDQLDDNLTVPLMAWLVLAFVFGAPSDSVFWPGDLPREWLNLSMGHLLAVNAGLGLLAWRLRWVNLASCTLGILFGSVVLLGAGGVGYLFLLVFYFISQLSTFIGKRLKEQRGIAEADGGRRAVGSVFSKGLIPAFFALVSPSAFIAALAVYTADTVASEIGKTWKGRAFSLWRLRRVPTGTVGGISLRGSGAGLCAIALFVLLAWIIGHTAEGRDFFSRDAWLVSPTDHITLPIPSPQFDLLLGAIALASVAAFFAESLLNEVVIARGWFSKEMAHLFLGGFAGALTHGLVLAYFALQIALWHLGAR